MIEICNEYGVWNDTRIKKDLIANEPIKSESNGFRTFHWNVLKDFNKTISKFQFILKLLQNVVSQQLEINWHCSAMFQHPFNFREIFHTHPNHAQHVAFFPNNNRYRFLEPID